MVFLYVHIHLVYQYSINCTGKMQLQKCLRGPIIRYTRKCVAASKNVLALKFKALSLISLLVPFMVIFSFPLRLLHLIQVLIIYQ